MKKEYMKNYKKEKIITRVIDFYERDTNILEYSKTINFSAFVKNALQKAMEESKNGKGHL